MKNRDENDSPPITLAKYPSQRRVQQSSSMPCGMSNIIPWLGLFAIVYFYFRHPSLSAIPCKCSMFHESESLSTYPSLIANLHTVVVVIV